MIQEYFIGIDIGTTRSKGVIIKRHGEAVAECFLEHGVSRPQQGWAEHDAENVWWRDFIHICQMLLEKSSAKAEHIQAIGCSALCPVLLPVDRSGKPLRNSILYGIDSRTAHEIKILISTIGNKYSIANAGNAFNSQSILPKILWLKRNEPQVFKKTLRFLGATSYLIFKLTNNYVIDHGTASAGGLPYNINSMKWDDYACSEIGVNTNQFPALHSGVDIAGYITKSAAVQTGLIQGTPVVVGTGDRFSESFSLGALKKGRGVISYGTTFAMDVCTNKIQHYPGLFVARTCLPDNFIIGAGLACGGGNAKWFRDNFGQIETEIGQKTSIDAYETLNIAAGKIRAGSDGLVVLPYFNGERAPIFNPDARGVIFGLTMLHGRYHIYRSILEGVGYGIRHIAEMLQENNIPIKRIKIVGGGATNQLWPQIISDILQTEQISSQNKSGAHFGAAYLAGIGTEALKYSFVEKQWNNCDTVIKPNLQNKIVYDKLYNIFRKLYNKTSVEMHELAGI